MKSYLLKLFGREEGPYAEPQIAQMFADYFMSFARRQWWVANGCALWLKYAEDDAFVVTAYLTDKPKAGEDLWPIK